MFTDTNSQQNTNASARISPVFSAGTKDTGVVAGLKNPRPYLHPVAPPDLFSVQDPYVCWTLLSEISPCPVETERYPSRQALASILPVQLMVQSPILGVQQGRSAGQELPAAAGGLEFQQEEAQAEHGSHLLQLPSPKLQTLQIERGGQ